MSCILCIDVGTSRIKTALVDECGRMLSLHSERIERTASPDTQNVIVWRNTSVSLLRSMTEEIRKYKPIAVSLTGNMHALLGLDDQGQPVSDAVLWCSNAASAEAEMLEKKYPGFASKYGNKPASVFALPKILMCKEKTPDLYRRTRCFLQPKDDIGYFLTGHYFTDPSDASGVMPFLPDERRWDSDVIRELGLDPEKFPTVIESTSVRGTITEKASEQTGLPCGLPVICGAGDLATAALGCGASGTVLSLTLGTAGQLLASGPRGCWHPLAGKLFVFAHADPESDLYLGSVPGGGFSYEWEATHRNLTMEQFFKSAEHSHLKEDLPVYLPYLLGRGAPYMDYVPCASWSGIGSHHSVNELCRSVVFGPLAALRQSADLLAELTHHPYNKVVLQSLACREKAVRETACALFPQKKLMPENTEASLLGAAVIGMVGMNVYSSFREAVEKMVHTVDLKDVEQSEKDATSVLYHRYLNAAERVHL